MTLICIILFLALSWWLYKFTLKESVMVKLPFDKERTFEVSGLEGLVVAMFATCWIGLSPVLSIRLGFLELLCIIGLYKSKNYLPFSFPLKFYIIFIIWLIIGLFYSPSPLYGVRMILKYIYPFLFALLCAKVVRNKELFLLSGSWCRYLGSIGIILLLIPFTLGMFGMFLWSRAACVTGLITIIVFSFALAFHSNEKKKNLIWGFLLCLPALIVVYRTDIFGTAVALSMFFFLKYKFKSIPVIGAIGLLGLVIMFQIPSVKQKMFWNPDQVTMQDYLSGNIDENQVRDNMRKFMWEDAKKNYYEGHETIGSGTGAIQHFFYELATDSRRGGQMHNDFLVLRCDNGNIGLALFIIAYFLVYFHCMKIYREAVNPITQVCALVAGASLLGVFVTMYSDNSLSYSMVTLSPPWGFYGMALGLKEVEQ